MYSSTSSEQFDITLIQPTERTFVQPLAASNPHGQGGRRARRGGNGRGGVIRDIDVGSALTGSG